LVLAGPARARAADARWRIDAGGGAFVATSSVGPLPTTLLGFSPGGTPNGEDSVDYDPGESYSAGLGYRLAPFVDVDARFLGASSGRASGGRTTHASLSSEVGFIPGEIRDIERARLDVYSFTAGGRVFATRPAARVRPWLDFHVGWYRIDGRLDGLLL